MMALWTVPIVVDDPVLFILIGTLPVMVLPRVINCIMGIFLQVILWCL